MFLDHDDPAYQPDLKLCEHLGLVTTGSVLVADKVKETPYLEYGRSTVAQKREQHV